MAEKRVIIDDEEKAVIMCLQEKPERKLRNKTIRSYVEKYCKSDANLTRKIQRMAERGLILCIKEPFGKHIHLYYLNPEFEYELEGPPLKPLTFSDNEGNDAQQAHSLELKKAIQTCIDNLLEPNSNLDYSDLSVITDCESHLLFHDLSNHLPGVGSNFCDKWYEYKNKLTKLDQFKHDLLSLLGKEIRNCFEGINLRFVYEEDNLADYECYLNPFLLYKTVIKLESDEEGYNNYLRFLSWIQENTPIIEKDDYVLWGKEIPYLRVPNSDRANLEAGVSRFISFFERISESEFPSMVVDLESKVDELKIERENLILESKRCLLYTSFSGECKYLV